MDSRNTRPFSEQESERWLLERTYHARLRDGRELSVPDFTLAMTQLIDFPVLLSTQPATSRLPERLPSTKSSNFSVPLPTWKEISAAEATALSHAGSPILLYGEQTWEHPQGASETWRPNRNMRTIIYGDTYPQPEVVAGTKYAVCYLDPKRGAFANDAWRAWFSPDIAALLAGTTERPCTFFAPCVQFPYTTHYTVMDASGRVHEYADRAEAIQGFQAFPLQEVGQENDLHTIFPQFHYYHEVICPDGVYRLEFFGPRMAEQGYLVKAAAHMG